MNSMHPLSADRELDRLADQFAHWRECRATPRERIPQPLWDQAVLLTQALPISRVAKRLGLCTTDLKKRCVNPPTATHRDMLPDTLSFVQVSAPALWPPSSAEVDLQRADGVRMHIVYRESQPPLAALVRTFLET